MNKPLAYFARTNTRGQRIPFEIQYCDRMSHVHIIGKTGAGKTTLLESLVRQDIENGYGITLLDPHGDFVERVYESVPETLQNDVIYFDVADCE